LLNIYVEGQLRGKEKYRLEGGDEIKKRNRPISSAKEGLSKRKVLKDYFLFWKLCTKV